MVEPTQLELQNKDFDTGKSTRPGEYKLADRAYAHLLDIHAGQNFAEVTPELRQNILAFYSDAPASLGNKKDNKAWQKTLGELSRLKDASVQSEKAGPK